jgi:hypothetical protein
MDEEYERDKAAHRGRYNEAGAYPSGLDSIPREISSCQGEIREAEDEMEHSRNA